MAQFDVFRLTGGQLVVDLQTDLIGIDASRIVAPLRDAGRYGGLLPDGAKSYAKLFSATCTPL